MIEATVNGGDVHQVEVSQNGPTLNGHSHNVDIHQYGERLFHSIHRQSSYAIELLEADYPRKQFVFKIRGKVVTVQLQDELDRLVEQLGMAQSAEAVVKEVTAPMPGLIVGLTVEAGQAIEQGDSMLTLEAMKMENVIKSPVDGTVATIHVKAGDSVDKNQLLVSFEHA